MWITNDRMRHHRVPPVPRHTPDLIGEKPVLTRNIYSSILCSHAAERDRRSPVKVFSLKSGEEIRKRRDSPGFLNGREEVGPLVQIRFIAILCPYIGGNDPGTTCSINIDPPTAVAQYAVLPAWSPTPLISGHGSKRRHLHKTSIDYLLTPRNM